MGSGAQCSHLPEEKAKHLTISTRNLFESFEREYLAEHGENANKFQVQVVLTQRYIELLKDIENSKLVEIQKDRLIEVKNKFFGQTNSPTYSLKRSPTSEKIMTLDKRNDTKETDSSVSEIMKRLLPSQTTTVAAAATTTTTITGTTTVVACSSTCLRCKLCNMNFKSEHQLSSHVNYSTIHKSNLLTTTLSSLGPAITKQDKIAAIVQKACVNMSEGIGGSETKSRWRKAMSKTIMKELATQYQNLLDSFNCVPESHENVILLHSGSKMFWRTQSHYSIIIYRHLDLDVLEVIYQKIDKIDSQKLNPLSYTPSTMKRIYLHGQVLNEMIEKKVGRLISKVICDRAQVTTDAVVAFVLSRLQAHQNDTSSEDLRIREGSFIYVFAGEVVDDIKSAVGISATVEVDREVKSSSLCINKPPLLRPVKLDECSLTQLHEKCTLEAKIAELNEAHQELTTSVANAEIVSTYMDKFLKRVATDSKLLLEAQKVVKMMDGGPVQISNLEPPSKIIIENAFLKQR